MDRRDAVEYGALAELARRARRFREFSQNPLPELTSNVDGRCFPFLGMIGRPGGESIQQGSRFARRKSRRKQEVLGPAGSRTGKAAQVIRFFQLVLGFRNRSGR